MLLNMAAVYLRSHSDISAGRETVPVKVDDNVCLQDSGLLDFMVFVLAQHTYRH